MTTPQLSVIVIIHRMSRQAANTLYSLSPAFQRNVSGSDYEIVVVENDSDDALGQARAEAQAENLRYFQRQEPGVSPVPALNFGFEQSRAPLVGFIIDGARMVTPRTIEYALAAGRIFDHPLCVVPGYHLGAKQHHFHETSGYSEEVERELLEKIDWKNNGYDLFSVCCFSGANPRGFFTQFLESNCFFCRRESFEKIGRADPRFNLPGGGSVNIFVYHALARLPESRLVVLAGEGSFHQFHGGVTTMEVEDRDERLQTHRTNLAEVFGGPFKGMHREPTILGSLPAASEAFLQVSSKHASDQYFFCRGKGVPQWHVP
jgi:glycosyltransferase involved in cell wall biosynthesis